MKSIKYISAAALMLALVACQSEDDFAPGYQSDSNAVKINVSIAGVTANSRANSDGNGAVWSDNDRIQVNNTSRNSIAGKNVAHYAYSAPNNNWALTDADGATTNPPYLVWMDGENTFEAFYPYVKGTANSFSEFTIPYDQTTLEGLYAADWMTASTATSKTADNSVDLTFKHELVKVKIQITGYTNQYPDPTMLAISEAEFKTPHLPTAITDKTVSLQSTSIGNTIKSYMVEAPTTAKHSFTAIMMPGKYNKGGVFFSFLLKQAQETSYSLQSVLANSLLTDTGLEAGKAYTFNLIVGKNKLEIGSVTVNDWDTGTEIAEEGEAEEQISVWDGTVATSFAGGDGSEENPYLIEDASQLAYLATQTKQFGLNYKLCTNIDLNNREWIPIGSGDYENNDQSVFSGTFDGDGHTIYGLKVTGTEKIRYVGLFGRVLRNFEGTTTNIAICNLNIKGAQVTPATTIEDQIEGCGILMGRINNGFFDGKIQIPIVSGCHVSGTIYASNVSAMIGGIVGVADESKIENCSADVIVTGRNGSQVGGFGGWILDSEIKNCTAKGTIDGKWSLGGFAGAAENLGGSTTITDCTASVAIGANDWNVGGFVGYTNATISGCSASGNLTSNFTWTSHTYKTGGFVGTNAGTIANCSYAGTITYADNAQYYGGFLGYDENGTTTGCRFDGTKNPALATNGMSTINGSNGTNDISNSLN